MKKWLFFLLSIIIFAFIHEGCHALIAMLFREYRAFVVHPYGFEVIFKTPVPEREGIEWGFISGVSNVITLLLGYLMFSFREKIAGLQSSFLSTLGYWLIVFFLLVDAFNLSIGPFIYGGDIGGIVRGFSINRYLIQILFFAVLLLNRELIVQKLFPVYGIESKYPLFRPWIRLNGKR